jgi:hypothetical protein
MYHLHMEKQKTGIATPSNVANKGATTSSDLDKILAMPTGGASGGAGSYSLDTKIALDKDALEKAAILKGQPKKLIKMIAYLCKKNNSTSVSIKELTDLGNSKEGLDNNLGWRVGEDRRQPNVEYSQDISTICVAYAELFGHQVNKPRTKAGVCNALKIAN